MATLADLLPAQLVRTVRISAARPAFRVRCRERGGQWLTVARAHGLESARAEADRRSEGYWAVVQVVERHDVRYERRPRASRGGR
jgi:hypothetical protein